MNNPNETMREVCAEIARLRAALKPVVECDLAEVDTTLNCMLMRCHNAVREAQRIMRDFYKAKPITKKNERNSKSEHQ